MLDYIRNRLTNLHHLIVGCSVFEIVCNHGVFRLIIFCQVTILLKESDEEVASVNGRVNVHQTGPSDVSKYEEPPIEKPVGKISSIDKYKQNYMKKADAPMSGNSTPNVS